MADAIYRRDGDVYAPTRWAGSPWSVKSQHGGPVNALLTRAVAAAAADAGFVPARITIDLLGPVPMEPLRLRSGFVRRGRRMAVVEAALSAGERDVARAGAVLMAASPGLPRFSSQEERPLPGPEGLPRARMMSESRAGEMPPGFHLSLELRPVPGADSAAWLTSPLDLVEGEPTTPLLRAAAVSDLTFGLSFHTMSAASAAREVMLINTDTTLYFERLPEGEWFGFRHEIVADRDGIGLAEVSQYDRRGRYGRALQVLLANPR